MEAFVTYVFDVLFSSGTQTLAIIMVPTKTLMAPTLIPLLAPVPAAPFRSGWKE